MQPAPSAALDLAAASSDSAPSAAAGVKRRKQPGEDQQKIVAESSTRRSRKKSGGAVDDSDAAQASTGKQEQKQKPKVEAASNLKGGKGKRSKLGNGKAQPDKHDVAKAAAAAGKRLSNKSKSQKKKRSVKPVVPPASEPAVLVIREVKDRFRMPEDDHALIGALKKRAKKAGQPTRKSDLLRAGLHLLSALEPGPLLETLAKLGPHKSPSKSKSASKRRTKPGAKVIGKL